MILFLATVALATTPECPSTPERGVHSERAHFDKQISAQGRNRAGKRHGLWCFYSGDGALTSEHTYSRGQLDGRKLVLGNGEEESWYEAGILHGPYRRMYLGRLVEEGLYEAGKRQGPWLEPDSGGPARGTYEGGRREGSWTMKNGSGEVLQQTYLGGTRHGVSQLHDATGELQWLKTYDMGRIHGYAMLPEDGNLYAAGELVGDDRIGEWVFTREGKEVARYGLHRSVSHGPFWDVRDGILREGQYVHGKRQGTFRHSTPEGQLLSLQDWDLDLLHGVTETYDRSGQQLTRATYVRGTIEGLQEAWNTAGELQFRGEMRAGIREGVWTEIEDGKRLDGSYVLGVPDGQWTVHLGSLLVEERSLDRGKKQGLQRTWHLNGQLASECGFDQDLAQGACEHFFEDGQQESASMSVLGVLHGRNRTWARNGQLLSDRHYVHGQLEGVSREWMPNGQSAGVCEYAQGAREGLCTSWHDNGKKASSGRYRAGEQIGRWVTWSERGQLQSEGSYRDGEQVGVWKLYGQGYLRESGPFAHGNRTGTWTRFGPDGTAIGEHIYEGGVVVLTRERGGEWEAPGECAGGCGNGLLQTLPEWVPPPIPPPFGLGDSAGKTSS